MRQTYRALLIALVAATWIGCSGSSPSAPSSTGSALTVMLKDSPFSDAKSLLVKKLATAQDVLGTGPLQAGHYTQIRLVVTSAALYFDNAAAGAACAPSIAAPAGRSADVGVSSGDVKLNREFDVTSSGATTILVDFNGDQSVKQQGNGSYSMTPVITVVSVQ
jgi:hypothetical protein